MDDVYNIEKYTEEELFTMLDLNNPSDRELEMKLLTTIDQYAEIDGEDSSKIKAFFQDAYEYFFPPADAKNEESADREGMETQNQNQNQAQNQNQNQSQNQNQNQEQQVVQTTNLEYGKSSLNPLLKETQKRVLQLDSQFRNYGNYPSSTDYIINLSEVLNNVVSLRLHSISIPFTWYNVSNVYNANYFRLKGNVDGINTEEFDLKFEIKPGSYNAEELVGAINDAITVVKEVNTDIDFGTTQVTYNKFNSKINFIFDIQQIYNETNFFLYFGKITNAFDENVRSDTIPGFLGFANIVIPKFQSSNATSTSSYTSVPNTYSLESVYSNFQYSLQITGITTSSEDVHAGNAIKTNHYDPSAQFYLVKNDASQNVVGNNYFTIISYEGPGIYDAETSIVLDTAVIEFGTSTGLYTRDTLLQLINTAMLSNEKLSNNSFLHLFNAQFENTDGSITTLQRFQMMMLLNRETTTKKKNAKQVVLFPNEQDVLDGLSSEEMTQYWTGPLWTGLNSCFLFDENTNYASPNTVKSEASPLSARYNVTSSPQLQLRCTKPLYDNTYNNRSITLASSEYILNDYVGIYNYTEQYKQSEINTKLQTIKNENGQTITNGFVHANAFYDVGSNRVRMQYDILTYFNENDYLLDMTNSFFLDLFPTSLTSNYQPDGTPITNTNTANISFPFTVTNTNYHIVVKQRNSTGLKDIPDYTLSFRIGIYRTLIELVTMINETFAAIQGTRDKNNTELHGLNMAQSKITIQSTSSMAFTCSISNKLTQNDYEVVLSDTKSDYENPWIDTDGNERYFIEREAVLDADGNETGEYLVRKNTPTSTSQPFAGTSWSALLGFTQTTYSLQSIEKRATRELVAERDVMQDPTKTMLIDSEYLENNTIFFTPQSTVSGLKGSQGLKKVTLSIPSGLYSLYQLYNQINTELAAIPETKDSIVYSAFDGGNEYSVFQMNINESYTAKDYVLMFYDDTEPIVQNMKTVTNNSFGTTAWDVTVGWLMGFRSQAKFDFNDSELATTYNTTNNFVCDSETGIVTMEADTCLDLYLYKNLYLIVDDFTQNHLNDGLITGVRNNPNAERPSYANNATRVCNPQTKRNQSSIFSASQPGMGLTSKQLYAANVISEDNFEKQGVKLYSDPPYVKDMFALIPLKVSGLSQGSIFTEYGGTLQDNDRKYFGPVNITKLKIQLLNDHGDVIDLNGNNWSFSLVFEYLYNMKGV